MSITSVMPLGACAAGNEGLGQRTDMRGNSADSAGWTHLSHRFQIQLIRLPITRTLRHRSAADRHIDLAMLLVRGIEE